MVKPITLTQITALPDIASTFSWLIQFGSIPGVSDSIAAGRGGQALAIKNASVAFPQIVLGQIRAPCFGFPRAFAGNEDHQNRFQATFYEDSRGGTWRTLWAWRQQVKEWESQKGKLLAEYSVPIEMVHFDTTGKPLLTYMMTEVWPTTMTPPQFQQGSSDPAIVEVEFSFGFFNTK